MFHSQESLWSACLPWRFSIQVCTQPIMGHHGQFLTTDHKKWFLERGWRMEGGVKQAPPCLLSEKAPAHPQPLTHFIVAPVFYFLRKSTGANGRKCFSTKPAGNSLCSDRNLRKSPEVTGECDLGESCTPVPCWWRASWLGGLEVQRQDLHEVRRLGHEGGAGDLVVMW